MCKGRGAVSCTILLLGLLLTRGSAAHHVALLYCQPQDNGEILVMAIDSSPTPGSPTRASKGRSCSQVVHEILERGYRLMSEALPSNSSGPLVFIFEHAGKE